SIRAVARVREAPVIRRLGATRTPARCRVLHSSHNEPLTGAPMDAHALPDDPRDWPTDPFELLGVARSVSESDLKRASTRLIRKYNRKPAPKESRRIRDPSEAAVEMSRWYRAARRVRDPSRAPPFSAPPPAEKPAPVEKPAPETSPDE